MSGALSLLAQLEEEQNKSAPRGRNSIQGKAKSAKSVKSRPTSVQSRKPLPKARPTISQEPISARSQNPPPNRPSAPTTPRTSNEYSDRSRSQGPDSRRISFAEPKRPGIRPLTIFSKGDGLYTGFPFIPKLNKYGLSQHEWEEFNQKVLEAAWVSKVNMITWMWKKKEISKRIKSDLQFGGDLKSFFAAWNKGFRKRGFTIMLDFPSKEPIIPEGATEAEVKQAKKDRNKWRLIISVGNTSAASIYSKSSLADSVSREATIRRQKNEELDQVNAAFPQSQPENDTSADDTPADDGGNISPGSGPSAKPGISFANHTTDEHGQSNGIVTTSTPNVNENEATNEKLQMITSTSPKQSPRLLGQEAY